MHMFRRMCGNTMRGDVINEYIFVKLDIAPIKEKVWKNYLQLPLRTEVECGEMLMFC